MGGGGGGGGKWKIRGGIGENDNKTEGGRM